MLYKINPDLCINCGSCRRHCPFDAIVYTLHHQIDPTCCTGCTLCYVVCPVNDDDRLIVPVRTGKIIAVSRERKRRLRRNLLRTQALARRNWDPLADEMPAFDDDAVWAPFHQARSRSPLLPTSTSPAR